MSLTTRILLLTALSVAGIALLAPLAARSADTAISAGVEQALLPVAESEARAAIARGDLSQRDGAAAAATSGSTTTESLDAGAIPTPASAPMEATLHSVATPPPAPAIRPESSGQAPASSSPPASTGDSVWDDLAQCESGGNWSINTGNGYYGGLQFSYGTWHDYGGGEFADYPHQASREEQIIVAERLHAERGFSPWPACRLKLGLP